MSLHRRYRWVLTDDGEPVGEAQRAIPTTPVDTADRSMTSVTVAQTVKTIALNL